VNCYVLHAFESAFGCFMLRIGCVCMWLVFGLEGLSPIGVWDVLGGWTHDGHGTG